MTIASVDRSITQTAFSHDIVPEQSAASTSRKPMRALPFVARATRNAAAIAGIAAAISGCADDLTAPNFAPPSSATAEQQTQAGAQLLATAAGPLVCAFATYDGSGEVVHPDVVSFPTPWNGHRLWNAITPYPNSAIRFENPSLYASEDGDTWTVPGGVINPLAKTSRGYLSDPDMIFEPNSNQLWLYYREVENRPDKKTGKMVHVGDHVWMTTSPDGSKWSAPRRLTTDTGKFVVSPSIVRLSDTQWSMYQIEANRDGCSSKANRVVMRKSTNGTTWTAPAAVSFSQAGFVPWHLDVQYIASRQEYWAMIAAYQPAKGCTTTSLFLATSKDGKSWTTYASPIMAPGEIPQFATAVYRSTFAFGEDDKVTIWYSGAKTTRAAAKGSPGVLAWSAAVSHTTATAILARVNDRTRTAQLSVIPTGGSVSALSTSVP